MRKAYVLFLVMAVSVAAYAKDPLEEKLRTPGATALGAPSGAERPGAGGGRVQAFANGAVYWSEGTGAQMVMGPVLVRYEELGAEAGPLGYPVSEERMVAEGRQTLFEHGSITLTGKGAVVRRTPGVTFSAVGVRLQQGLQAVKESPNSVRILASESFALADSTIVCACEPSPGSCQIILQGDTVQCRRGSCSRGGCVVTLQP